MKWVTRDFVHLDRVASPWLIKRFIDKEAVFGFVPWDQSVAAPQNSTPFALPGAEIGPHDKDGTTFAKLLAKYKITDKAAHRIGSVVTKGVDYVLHGYRPGPDDTDGQSAVGLLAMAEGMLLLHHDDNAILEASFPIYDALYTNFRAHQIMEDKGGKLPDHGTLGPTNPTRYLRRLLKDAGPAF
jgi:hypothetical protein